MAVRPWRRTRSSSISSKLACASAIPAKKPPQSLRAVPQDPYIRRSDLAATTPDWTAMVVVMCVCGWDMNMNGAAAYCTNP